jgi:hypothetical protein
MNLQVNLRGAMDRPALNEVWANAEAKMNGKPVAHMKYSLQSAAAAFKQKPFG